MKAFVPIWSAALLAAALGLGQSPTRPEFEVASVKPSPPMPSGFAEGAARLASSGVRLDPAQATFTRVSLTDLIARAYRVRAFQVSGPEWMAASYYDIAAKMPAGFSADSLPEMLQSLLEERFKLALHFSSKDFELFVLSVADGGPKIAARPADYKGAGTASPRTMESCATSLSLAFGRPVLDETGMQGQYLFPQEYLLAVLKRASWQRILEGRPEMEEPLQIPSEGQIRRAVEGLGLKLELRKEALPLLKIDRVERTPAEN